MPCASLELQRSYQRRWMRRRREAFFEGKACAACGAREDLELDHRDPAAKVCHRVWSWSKPRRLKELAKCQPLCRSCHAHKTARDNARRQHRLTREQVEDLRRAAHAGGLSPTAEGARLGVSRDTIKRAVRGETWPDVGVPPYQGCLGHWHADGGERARCGAFAGAVLLAPDESRVTCPDCLAALPEPEEATS